MSETTAAAELRGGRPEKSAGRPAWLGRAGDFLVRSILPLVLALGTGAIILWAIGVDPIQYYKDVWSGGFEFAAWQDTAMRVAPLLLIALIFRTMEAFKTFDLPFIMSGQASTETIAVRLYKMAFQEWQTGRSSALAYIVLIVVLAITNIYVKYLNRVKER